MNKNRIITLLVLISVMVSNLFGPLSTAHPVQAAGEPRTDALVLVNSNSLGYLDFQHFILPYLDNLGVPYTLLDIAAAPVPDDIGLYALIIVGHRQLDIDNTFLDSTEQALITSAINAGTGLVNFDNDLSADASSPRYAFVNTVFGFSYTTPLQLTGVTFTSSTHYISQKHTPGEAITTGIMRMAGISLPLSNMALAFAGTGNEPFLTVTNFGQGRAVQWGTYDWMSHAVKGPLFGFDDLVWRSLVWAARKPFVMQGMPPFATMRMDDAKGPFTWVHEANDYGFIPWLGVFTNQIDAGEAADLSALTQLGKASVGIHAFDTANYFYFDHPNGVNFSDSQVDANFLAGSSWFADNNIPKSKYLVGHNYELGSNVFNQLAAWDVQFIGAPMDPGLVEIYAPWAMQGPFRLYETGQAYDRQHPVYYADYVAIPGHTELNGQFFNCLSEIRDITGYEWLPSQNVATSIQQGTQWMKRALDSMDLATLFTHEYQLTNPPGVSMEQWRQMMQGITQNIAGYNPIYVSMDDACQYVRATRNSNITAGIFNPVTNQTSTTFGGSADVPTKFYVFSDSGGVIHQNLVDVPAFSTPTQVTFTVPGPVNHISITPSPVTVVQGNTQQFSAQAYDAANTLIPDLTYTWSVINGGGSISAGGLFTASLVPGTYSNTVIAEVAGVQGSTTVDVIATSLDHFTIDAITSPKYVATGFPVTIRAMDAGGNLVVTYNGPVTLTDTTGTIQPTVSGSFVNGVWTGTITVAQSANGVVFTAADGAVTSSSNPFDVIPLNCPCSIWNNTDIPAMANVNDGISLELGVKFRSDLSGYITGLRFYKGNLNNGTHTGNLWKSDGTLLATVVFNGETASGWQQVALNSPVAITANTTYIASYYSPRGNYSVSPDYFTTAKLNLPLKALADGEDGFNGVFRTGTSGFPDLTWSGHAPNYWVDVVFSPTPVPDTIPPFIASTSPHNNATAVNVNSKISAFFSEGLDPASVNTTTFVLLDPTSNPIPASVAFSDIGWTASLTPSASLAFSTTYTAVVKSGATGVKDLAGNPLAEDKIWTFTTSAPPPPPPEQGAGGPILVIRNSSNPFSSYFAEILRAEGLNEFASLELSTVTSNTLNAYQVVILGEMPLTQSQVSMFTDWVNAGGSLIAMRPDTKLKDLLGLAGPAGTRSNAYMLVDTTRKPGVGIVNQTIQYHGAADLYTLNGATSIATLYADASTPLSNPAVTIHSLGSNGGQAAAFTFDLARSVVYTRQGNPAWAGQERDGMAPIRSDDLFYGNAASDPQPDWIDLAKKVIPQADEQQRLLANLIGYMNLKKSPLPRFWYLPQNYKAVVVMTGDDHTGIGTAGRFDLYIAASHAGCSIDNWECIRASAYIYPTNGLPDAAAANYNALGFEIATHINTGCDNYTLESLTAAYTDQLSQWLSYYPSLPSPSTERTHCIVWSDWSSQALVEQQNNIRLDLNYYFWPTEWVHDQPGLLTGSSMPMRFTDLNGTMIDVYQAVTQMTDESGQSYPFTAEALLDKALGPEGYYGVFTANMHNDAIENTNADAIINAALARGVPVISGQQLLKWLDGRNSSSFVNLTWNGNVLGFNVAAGEGANGLKVLVPLQSDNGSVTHILLDGNPITYSTETIKGVMYATFLANAGSYQAVYESDTTPPTINNVTVTPNVNGTATVTWNTDEPSDTRVDYGTDPNNLALSVENGLPVTSHSIVLNGLQPENTYYYRVSSADSASNSSTWPITAEPPASFNTPLAGIVDTTVADFNAGTLDANTITGQVEDGEVLLKPAIAEEFLGTSLPVGWSSAQWTGGTSLVSGGLLLVDGARAYTDALYTPGRAMEFTATFGAASFQNAGFGQTLADFSETWAVFSTFNTANSLYVRTNNQGATIDTLIPGNWIGTSHRYRIEWNPTSVVYYIDGTPVHTDAVSLSADMHPIFSDYSNGSPALQVDRIIVTPYALSGVFTSRVFDAGSTVNWKSVAWTNDIPAGAGIAISVRSGDTPVPDGSWTGLTSIVNPGDPISIASRYIQYQAILSTANPDLTPALKSVTIAYALLPVITTQPVDQTVNSGENASFTASATGDPLPMTQWQANSGSGWSDVPGATANTFTFTTQASDNGKQYRAVFSNIHGSVNSNAATLTVYTAPTLDTQPSDQTVTAGQTAFFTAHASGNPTPAVQWQANSGSGWLDILGATSNILSVTTQSGDNGKLYRAIFTNLLGSVTTNAATLTVNSAPVVTTQPLDQAVLDGQTAAFTAAANGNPAPTVQWQVNAGSGWLDIPDATTTTLSFIALTADNGKQVRAVFTNLVGSVNSNAATLSINTAPLVTTHPADQTVNAGQTASFTAVASGNPAPTVQWQVNAGTGWVDIPDATTAILSFTAQAADNGRQVRAVFTNLLGSATTDPATLTVNDAPVVTTQPADQSVNEGQLVSFTAAAGGYPAPTIQWQVNDGTGWTDIPGATASTLSFTAQSADNGKQYHALFTNPAGSVTSNAATLTVNTAPVVTTHPADQMVNAGQTATFTAAASGNPAPTVQWQVNDGTGWLDIPGATTSPLSFTTQPADNGKQYRAVFTNLVGSTTSNAATLNINIAPVVTSHPADQTVSAGQTAAFTAAASGNPAPSVQWQVNDGNGWLDIPDATTATLSFTVQAADNGKQYRAVFTNLVGSITSDAAALTVNWAPEVTSQPQDQSVVGGQTATFTAAAGGNPTPTVQWQVNDGSGWVDVPDAITATLSFTAQSADNGKQYRAVFTNLVGSVTSNAVVLTVSWAPEITSNPSDQSMIAGQTATFTAAAGGNPAPAVQWQVNAGSAWVDIPDAITTTLSFTTQPADNGRQYRAVFTNLAGSAATNPATLTVRFVPVVTTQPSNQSVTAGQTVSFTAAADSSPTATIRWQVNSGAGWVDVPDASTTTLSFTVQNGDNGKQYRAIFTNILGSSATNAAVLTVNWVPAVTTQPANKTLVAGQTATFTAAASGNPAPSVQWQVNDGSGWVDVPDAITTTLSFTTQASDNARQYRAVFTNLAGSVASNPATLSVRFPPVVTTQPSNQSVTAGQTVSFTAAASANPAAGPLWQVSSNGGTSWSYIAGATALTYSFTAQAADNGKMYRVIFINSYGSTTSNPATLSVNWAPAVTTQPANKTLVAGQTVTFTAAASGGPAPSVQWQVNDGNGWLDIPDATTATLSFTTQASDNARQYRAVFTNPAGSATSNLALLVVRFPPVVTTQPSNQSVTAGQTVSFTAAASANPAAGPLWQVSSNGGTSWSYIAGATALTYSFTAQASDNGKMYRVVFINSYGSTTSNPATLSVNWAPAVTTQPANKTLVAGQTVTFTAAASGSPVPSVQWQVNDGSGWLDIPDATTATLSFTTQASDNARQYRAVFTNPAGSATSNLALLVVRFPPVVTTQPSNQSVTAGQTVSFTAAASANPAAGPLWQVSSNGGTSWSYIAGATALTYSFTAQASDNGKMYRVVFINSYGSTTSNPATLSVNWAPAVTTQPANKTLVAGQTVTFTAAASGSPVPSVQWQVNDGSGWLDIPDATTATLSFTTQASDNARQYRAVFTNLAGSVASNPATLNVRFPPVVTTQPSNQSVTAGQTVSFTAAASANPAAGPLWQVSSNGGTSWSYIAGGTALTYSFIAQAADNGKMYRVVFINSYGSTTSNPATLTVN